MAKNASYLEIRPLKSLSNAEICRNLRKKPRETYDVFSSRKFSKHVYLFSSILIGLEALLSRLIG